MEGDVLLEGERVRLKVVHNGGDNFDVRLEEEMRKCDIVILLFDIASKPTMEKLKTKATTLLLVSSSSSSIHPSSSPSFLLVCGGVIGCYVNSGIRLYGVGTGPRR